MNTGLTLAQQDAAVSEALRELLKPKNLPRDTYFYISTWVYEDVVIYREDKSAVFKERTWSWGDKGEVVLGKDETEVAQAWVAVNGGAQNAQVNANIRMRAGSRRL